MVRIASRSRIFSSASASATKAPVIDAVRVPPSAWMTSQSTQMVRSPSAGRFVTDRNDRPIRRWISCVRPPTFPCEASRCIRVLVARGSMPYSAVTQPFPLLRRKGGTRSSTLAVQMTLVCPALISTDPSAWIVYSGMRLVSRSWLAGRWSDRMTGSLLDPREIFRERTPEIDVTRERVHFLAVNEQLHGSDRGQVRRQHVHDGVHREQLVDGAAGVSSAGL